MTSNVKCWTPQLAALAIATSLLTACATVASEPRVATVCPPVVEYTRELQVRAADELDLLQELDHWFSLCDCPAPPALSLRLLDLFCLSPAALTRATVIAG